MPSTTRLSLDKGVVVAEIDTRVYPLDHWARGLGGWEQALVECDKLQVRGFECLVLEAADSDVIGTSVVVKWDLWRYGSVRPAPPRPIVWRSYGTCFTVAAIPWKDAVEWLMRQQ